MNKSKQSLNGILFAMLGDDKLVNKWWNSPNKAFNNALPIDVWIVNPDSVKKYIMKAANLNGDYH